MTPAHNSRRSETVLDARNAIVGAVLWFRMYRRPLGCLAALRSTWANRERWDA